MQKGEIIVIKIGSNVLTDDNGDLDLNNMRQVCEQIAKIHQDGLRVIMVSSGAIACGKEKLELAHDLKSVELKQAAASVGQSILMREYARFFERNGVIVGQVLLTADAFRDQQKKTNIMNTFNTLLKLNVVPIVNENDTVAVDEIKLGDNDMLSAYVSELVKATKLIILSDIKGLYDKNPKEFQEAKLIKRVEKISTEVLAMASGSNSRHGTGGMLSKLKAAEYATSRGITTYVLNGREEKVLHKLLAQEQNCGTEFCCK
jgi:glutamate 5-kinase